MSSFVVGLREVDRAHVSLVGSKGAQQRLRPKVLVNVNAQAHPPLERLM